MLFASSTIAGTVDVDMGVPTILASCSAGRDRKHGQVEEALRHSGQEPARTSSQHVPGTKKMGENHNLLWRIPSGNTCHTKFVGLLTSIVASLLCLYLLVELAFVHLNY